MACPTFPEAVACAVNLLHDFCAVAFIVATKGYEIYCAVVEFMNRFLI